jgi:hypothetical protein
MNSSRHNNRRGGGRGHHQLNRSACSTAAAAPVLLLLLVVAAAGGQPAAAQEQQNGQGATLWRLGQWLASNDAQALSALGWSDGGNPCISGWTGVACNDQGYVTSM